MSPKSTLIKSVAQNIVSPRVCLIIKVSSYQVTSIGTIRWSCYRLIFNMGIPKPGKDDPYIEMGPRPQWVKGVLTLCPFPYPYLYQYQESLLNRIWNRVHTASVSIPVSRSVPSELVRFFLCWRKTEADRWLRPEPPIFHLVIWNDWLC